jgi:hypothetical protein
MNNHTSNPNPNSNPKAVGGKELCVTSALNFMSRIKAETEPYSLKNGKG